MILFIGAGVSKLFGIPDTKGFIQKFDEDDIISKSDLYHKIKDNFGNDIDLEFMMTVLEDLSKESHDLFDSISPQTFKFFLKNELYKGGYETKLIDDARSLHMQMKKIIRDECKKAEVKEQQETLLKIFDPFVETLSHTVGSNTVYFSLDKKIRYIPNIRIITTNYDRCIETYLGLHQIPFTQGLVQRYGHMIFDVSTFNDGNNIIGLFKLHGSIDLYNIDGIIRRKIYDDEKGEEIVYYPIEFSGYRHIIESPYLELFYLFRDRINKDNKWVIIGSSLRDRTICSIMNDVIGLMPEGERPRVILVNPDNSIVGRLSHWGFNHLSNKINQILLPFGQVQTNNEILNRFPD